MAAVVAFLSLILVCSCVNEEYDMTEDNLNLEVTPFQEGLTLPIGSTDTLKLKELVKDLDGDILQTLEGGVYAVSMHDSFDMTEELSSISDVIEIPDVEFTRKVNFELNSVDVSKVRIDEMDYSFDHDISSSFKTPDIVMPSVSQSLEVAAGLGRFVPDPSQMALTEFPKMHHETHFMSSNDDLHLTPEIINDNLFHLDEEMLDKYFHVDTEFDATQNVRVQIELPEGISSVEDIVLHEGAQMKVTLELRNSFLRKGSLIPAIDVDLHNLFHLDGNHSDDHAHLEQDFRLSEENGYSVTNYYTITSLAISPDDWTREDADSPCILDKEYEIPASGELLFEDLWTTTSDIEEHRSIDIYMDIQFVNLQIDDVKVTIDPVVLSQEKEVELSMNDLKLPEEVKSISDVVFTEDSGFDIDIKSQNLSSIAGLNAELESLVLTFPEEVKVEGANASNELVYEGVDLSAGLKDHVRLIGLDMPKPVDGQILFSENIGIKAVAKADGTIHTADLPTNDAQDVKVLVDVKSNIAIEEYMAEVEGFEYVLEVEPEVITVELPEEMVDLGGVFVTPEGNPEILINLELPEVNMDLVPSDKGGLHIDFPDMFVFKTPLPKEYNYNQTENSITLRGMFPETIVLPIEKLWLEPETIDGKVCSRGEVSITGGLSVGSTLMTKEDLEQITAPGMKVSVKAHIPELIPSEVALDKFETKVSETIDLNFLAEDEVPEEVVSLGWIDFDDVWLNLVMDASKLPDLRSTELSLDFVVDLPDMVKVSGVETDADGNFKMSGTVGADGLVKVDPVKIEALDLSDVDIRKGIVDVINLDGVVTLSDAELNVDEWLGKDLEVEFRADIKDIDIASLTGKVDYKVNPVSQDVDLSEFSQSLNELAEDAVLDFNHVHLALDVKTNLGVPVNADVELVPYYDGRPDESKLIKLPTLSIKAAASSEETVATRYWLANPGSRDRCPAGYEFVEADILGLLRDIPEKIDFRLNAATDLKKECVLEPSADYVLTADYAFELPLEFGEDFNLTVRNTVEDIPSIVGQALSSGKIKLGGDITSSLPLGFELTVNMLDSEGNVVPMAEGCGKQAISPCGLDGSEVKTPLDLTLGLKEGVKSEVTDIELVFKATSAGVSGVPVTEDSFLHANLKAILPEGLTLDLGDLMENMDEQ